MSKRYIFGPIASRRLGISLGVDLVTPKICSLDCVYCEARKTTNLTLERREYVDVNKVIEELDDYLKDLPKVDFITFSGAGEPTLNSGIGKVVNFLKDKYPQYKICLLTNACSFNDPQVIADIERIDRIVPSLDGSNAEEFKLINRPAEGLEFDDFIEALTKFCKNSNAEIFIELFIVPNINDSKESQERFAKIIEKLDVDLVQLNTLDRPGTEKNLTASTHEKVEEFISVLSKVVKVEAVGKFIYNSSNENIKFPDNDEMKAQIFELIKRRPATLKDLSVALNVPEGRLHRIVVELVEEHEIIEKNGDRGVFYQV